MNQHILILGGGFGGIQAARSIAAKRLSNTDITLVSNKTYLEYYPALYRIVTGAAPIEVCVPLSDMLPANVAIVNDNIIGVDLQKKQVSLKGGETMSYDILVIALGSEASYFNLPGVETLSMGFKSVVEATKLKEHLSSLFIAHEHPSKEELVSHFHVVIVGGGPSGVEVAGDLAVYLRKLARAHQVEESLITIDLIEANPRVLPTLPERVSKKVDTQLRKLGINIFLNRTLMSEDVEKVYLKDMQMQAKTVIWTAGTRTNALLASITGLQFSPKKRVIVDAQLRAVGFQNVFVIGDAAQTPMSGLAQTAIADGKFIAEVIEKQLKNKKLPIYVSPKIAHAIPVGNKWAALEYGSFRIYGFIPYLIRHVIDFMYFAGMLPPNLLWKMYREGYKYRNGVK